MEKDDLQLRIIEWTRQFNKLLDFDKSDPEVGETIDFVATSIAEFVSVATEKDLIRALSFCLQINAHLGKYTQLSLDELDDLIFIPVSMNIMSNTDGET